MPDSDATKGVVGLVFEYPPATFSLMAILGTSLTGTRLSVKLGELGFIIPGFADGVFPNSSLDLSFFGYLSDCAFKGNSTLSFSMTKDKINCFASSKVLISVS
ncbi:Uncharacterised protein [Legionella pneumophila]|nr:Uncharacterised protein [Legionella pneumophila]